MRDLLAERLLASVMKWSEADVARERPILQALAALKYDEYQQFSPGMRFVESLARWLDQFGEDERNVAYNFIRARLIFLSEAEMAHFASVMFPDFIRPLLIDRAAPRCSAKHYHVGRIASSSSFERLQSATLFFGLSDGARIDQFRRSNRELSHEQIFPTFELPPERVHEIAAWLEKKRNGAIKVRKLPEWLTPLQALLARFKRPSEARVPAIVLLDDFAGSGTSYVREEGGKLKGKIVKFLERVSSRPEWRQLVVFPETTIILALYVATSQAVAHLESWAPRLKERFGATIDVVPVQLLDERVRIKSNTPEPFVKLIENPRYYDASLEDEHTKKGGQNVKFGFADCGLPLVLHHNAPNNSLFLIWVEDSERVRPLFERFSRHRSDA